MSRKQMMILTGCAVVYILIFAYLLYYYNSIYLPERARNAVPAPVFMSPFFLNI